MKKLLIALTLLQIFYPASQSREKIPVALIRTTFGDIYFTFHEETPKHKASFMQLAQDKYWDSLTFNRVIPNFVAQGGCPDTPEGFNDPEYLLEPEFHPRLRHIYGAVGAGRDGNPDKNSARCQFYIVQNQEGLHRLDGDYTVFGQVIRGMEIVDRIVNVSCDPSDQPNEDITLNVSIVYLNQKEIIRLKTKK